jgi:hypothetical protein
MPLERRALVACAVTLAAVVATALCPVKASASSHDACHLLTTAEAANAIGTPVTGSGPAGVVGILETVLFVSRLPVPHNWSSCAWNAAEPQSHSAGALLLGVAPEPTKAKAVAFYKDRVPRYGCQRVSGVGSAACFFTQAGGTSRTGGAELYARQGRLDISLTIFSISMSSQGSVPNRTHAQQLAPCRPEQASGAKLS